MGNQSLYQKISSIWKNAGEGNESLLDFSFLLAYLVRRSQYQHYLEIGVEGNLALLAASIVLAGRSTGRLFSVRKHTAETSLEIVENEAIEIVRQQPRQALSYFQTLRLERIVNIERKKKQEKETSPKNQEKFKNKKGYTPPRRKKELALSDFETDVLHLGADFTGEQELRDAHTLYAPFLVQGGLLVLSGDSACAFANEIQKKYILLYQDAEYVFLRKDDTLLEETCVMQKQGAFPLRGADHLHLQKMLPYILQNLHELQSVVERKSVPSIFIGIMTYNSSAYISQCLHSILAQKGDFTIDIGVFDDASTDNTVQMVRGITNIPQHITITVYENEKNGGYSLNYIRVFNQFAKSGCDYFACIDGDDYLTTPERFQRHLEELALYPECAISFNRFLYYDDDQKTYSTWDVQNDLVRRVYTAFDLASDYFIGNGSSSVVRRNAVRDIPPELFTRANAGDWMVNLMYALHGDILYINAFMNVYRKHSNGVWSKKSKGQLSRQLYHSLREFNKITHYHYYKEFFPYFIKLADHFRREPFLSTDLIICDDVFPHVGSGFRMAEYGAYLNHFKDISIFCTGDSVHILGHKTLPEVLAEYQQLHPEYADKLYGFHPAHMLNRKVNVKAKLAYFCFLGNAFVNVEWAEQFRIPFVFELYPGGLFYLNDAVTDMRLQRVFSSPCFRKVIVTQDITRDYLLKKKFCKEQDIIEIFGVVTPESLLTMPLPPKMPNPQKPLSLCFAAMRYTPDGSDKGYDVCLETARELKKMGVPFHLHVAGRFNEKVLPVKDLAEDITFHGTMKGSDLHAFFRKMDIIISPNVNSKISKGSFDGFPTGTCTEAGLCGVLIMCSDPLSLNGGRFTPQKDIEILPRDAQTISRRIAYYHENRDVLLQVVTRQYAKIQQLYGRKAQIDSRIALLESELCRHKQNREAIVQLLRQSDSGLKGTYHGVLFYAASLNTFISKNHIAYDFFVDNNGHFIALIDITRLAGHSYYFRLDFVRDTYVSCIFNEISVDGAAMNILSSTGRTINGEYFFGTDNPYLVLDKTEIPDNDQVLMIVRGTLTCTEKKSLLRKYAKLRQATLFYHGPGEQYTREKILPVGYEWQADDSVEIHIPLKDIPLDARWFRFDILEDEYCRCAFQEIRINEQLLSIAWTNGKYHDGYYYFDTEDPVIELEPYSCRNSTDVLTIRANLDIMSKEAVTTPFCTSNKVALLVANKAKGSHKAVFEIHYSLENEAFLLNIPLELFAGVSGPIYPSLQFLNHSLCTITIESLCCEGKALPYRTNGKIREGETLFLTDEPKIYINKDISSLPKESVVHLRGCLHPLTHAEISEIFAKSPLLRHLV